MLELGAGCGTVGVLAAQLGAAEVVLSDYVAVVLLNLRECVRMNARGGGSSGPVGEAAAEGSAPAPPGPQRDEAQQQQQQQEQQQWLSSSSSGSDGWDVGPMRVRYLDWGEALAAAGARLGAAGAAQPLDERGGSLDQAGGGACGAPRLPQGQIFDVVLAAEVLYEWPCVQLVPAVLAQRLAPGGLALLCCAVREQVRVERLSGEGGG